MDWFQGLISRLTYSVGPQNPGALLALYGLGTLTEIGVPFPFVLETFLFFASYNVGPVSVHVLLILLMLISGRETGAAIFYFVFRRVGGGIMKWVSRHFPGLSRNIDRFRPRLVERTVTTVVVVRLTPGLLQVPSIVSGVMRLPAIRFLLGVAISGLTYDFGLIILGYIAKLIALQINKEFEIYVISVFLAVIIVAWVMLFLHYRSGARKNS